MTAQPALHLLGMVRLSSGLEEIGVGGGRSRSILALLALEHPRAVSLNSIVASVWGEDPPVTVRNAVQVSVSNLRKVLRPIGADIVRAGESYVWTPGEVTVDVPRFEWLVAAGGAALRGGDVARGLSHMDDAIALWQGPPLDGLDAVFVEQVRPQLERTYRLARADRADALLRLGRWPEALAAASGLLHETPYDERVLELVVTALYSLGRSDEAAEAWTSFQRRLAGELGLDPSPRSQALYHQVLNHRLLVPVADPPPPADATASVTEPATVAAAQPPPVSAPQLLLGRDALVADLVCRLAGGERLISLVGLGGIGKTTVARATAHRLSRAGTSVTFCELETATDLPSALQRIGRDLGLDSSDDLENALAALPHNRCGLLVLDNVEQVDGLGPMLDRVLGPHSTLTALVTSRKRVGAAVESVVAVPALTVRDDAGGWGPAADLFWNRARHARPNLEPDAYRTDILALCDLVSGVPLAITLVAALCRLLTPRQLLDRTRRDTQLLLDTAGGAAVPDRQRTMRVVLDATVESLPRPARALLLAHALVDGWISLELLERVRPGAGADPDRDFLEGVDALLAAGLIELDLDGRSRLPVPVREHLREQAGPELPADAFVAALSHVLAERQQALTGPAARETVAALTGDDDALISALRRALERGWTDRAARIAIALNRYWLLSGRLTDGHRWFGEISALEVPDAALGLRIDLLAGTFAAYLSYPGARERLSTTLRRADEQDLPPDRVLVNAWCCLASQHAYRSAKAEADACVSRAGELADRSGDPSLVALTRDVAGHVAALAGDNEASLRAMVAGIADARRSGDQWDLASLLLAAADCLIALDRADDAALLLDEAFDLVQAGPLLIQVLIYRGLVLTMQGNLAAASGHLQEAGRLTQTRFPNPLFLADILHGLGTVAALAGRDELALRRWAAADAMLTDLDADPQHRQPGATRPERERVAGTVSAERRALLMALGAADPARTLAEALT